MPAKKTASKATKKTTKKAGRPAKVTKTEKVTTMPVETMAPVESTPAPSMMKGVNTNKLMRYALWIVLVALLTYKFGPWLFPARVGWRPISRFEVWNKLEKSYGTQALDDIVNQRVLDEALAKEHVTVDQSKVDEQMKKFEDQYANVGGIDEALKQNGLSRADLTKQIETELQVEQILADKVAVSDDEAMADFDQNKATLYKDQKYEDVKDSIVSNLRDGKLREAFLSWFADVKKDISVTNFGL